MSDTTATHHLFTAAQIAGALGKTARAIRQRLSTIRPAGECLVRGQRSPGWTWAQMPGALRAELLRVATRRGYRDALALLSTPPTRWEPKLPLVEVAEAAVRQAGVRREAFASSLAALNDLGVSTADFLARGLAEFRRVAGYSISAKQWQRWLDRIVTRDGGAEDWNRLEIYLDEDAPRRATAPTAATVAAAHEQPALLALIRSFADPSAPTADEARLLWVLTFERFEELTTAGDSEREARRALVAFLAAQVSTLAKNPHALHVAFNHKLAKWRSGEGRPSALIDGRADANKARVALVIGTDDRNTLLAFAAKHGGGLSQGWREALRRGALSAELVSRYIDNPASKSYVPRAIREQLGNDLALLNDPMHGPRQTKLGGAYIERNPAAFAAADWMQGDDCTLPNLYYEDTPDGPRLMRGQFLAMLDPRTFYILGFVLISAPPDRPSTYNAWHIRNLITTVHDTYGLPRRGFYFENGTWRAKVLTGKGADWSQTELGLREFGLRFIHARLPRAKVVERFFNSLQNLTEAEPGYVGRGWHDDRYERVEKAKLRVESGKIEPDTHFLTRVEWIERLTELVDRYNDEPQEGRYCDGLSPRQAYERHFGREPIVRLPDAARYLLANETRLLKVGRNGISFRAGTAAEPFTYKSEQTGPLIGRHVKVFFNRESPAILGVQHPDSGEVFAVRRATYVPGMDADDETLAQAFAENDAHDSYKRALYRAIVPKFSEHFMARPIFRPTILDGATVEAGRQFAASVEAEAAAEKRDRKLAGRTAAAAAKVGLRVRGGRTSETRAAAAEELAQLLSESEQKPSTP